MTLKGLAAFKAEKQRQQDIAAERDKPRAQYFNWKNNKNKEDKDVVYVRFLQEFVEGQNDRGLPVTLIEHQAPGKEGFKMRANCTMESEGRCYACERHAEDRAEMRQEGRTQPKGWGQKKNFYTWVLVDYKDGEGVRPVVLTRSFNASFTDDLILEVEEATDNLIGNQMWRIQRTGAGKQTQWKLRAAPNVELYDDSEVEVPDLEETVARRIAYDDQAAYYGAVYKEGDPLDNDDEPAKPQPAAQATKSGELIW